MYHKGLVLFKPGQSGNPKGRPKGKKDGVRGHLNRLLSKRVHPKLLELFKAKGIDLKLPTNAQAIAYALIASAQKSDIQAIKLILDHTELPLALENPEDGSVKFPNIVVNFVNKKASENGNGS